MNEAVEQDAKVVEQNDARPAVRRLNDDLARPVLDTDALATQARARRIALVLMVASTLLMLVLIGLAWSFVRDLL